MFGRITLEGEREEGARALTAEEKVEARLGETDKTAHGEEKWR